MRRIVLAILVVGCAAARVDAHGRSVSHSRWLIDGTTATVEVRIAQRDLAVRGVQDPGSYATARLLLGSGGTVCRADTVRTLPSADGWLTLVWSVACDGPPDRIDNHLFVDGMGARLHFARISRAPGSTVERVFGPSDVSMPLSTTEVETEAPAPGIGRYLALGVEHIVTGWDHLAFLAGLLVLAATLRDVFVLATGFTIAHSVTLALSVLGVARPDAAGVEALIGFSILLVAVENVWMVAGHGRAIPAVTLAALGTLMTVRFIGHGGITETTLLGLVVFTAAHFGLLTIGRRPDRLRAAVAFGFGLIHGFGFAGILHDAALPQAALLPALLGFNVGVEVGQLGAIVIAWPVLRAARGVAGTRIVVETVSAALAGLGTLWFVGRAFGS